MLSDNIFKEIKFGDKKCDSFLDVASYDQIKGKLDCLQFLSTPRAFDRMILTEQDFYQSNKEETFEKISTMTRLNNLEHSKKNKKGLGAKLYSSNRNKIKIDSSTKSLKGFFAQSVKNFDNANCNKFKDNTKAKNSLDILEFFKFSSEKGVTLQNMQKNLKTLKEVTEEKIKIKISKTIDPEERKLGYENVNKINEQNPKINFHGRKTNERDQVFGRKIILNRYRSSSSDNRISNFFSTATPEMVTLKRKNTIISQNKNSKLRSKSNLITLPIKKLMKEKNDNKFFFNEIMTTIQTNEKNLLTDTNIEDFCCFSMGRENLKQKDFENFLKLKKLEKESQKVIEPNYNLIYDKKSKKLEPFINTKLQKNIKNSSSTKKKFEKNSKLISVKNLFEKNPTHVDNNEFSRMIDYCYKSTKSNTKLLSENFKDHSLKNKLAEEVFIKLKGECSTPADEYIKTMTMENFKQKINFMHVSSRGINKKKLP